MPDDSPLDTGAKWPWFAIRVRSRFDKAVSEGLRSRNYESFAALYRVKRRWANRNREVEMPLFPGYVFSSFDPNNRLPILMCPGVVHLVGFGDGPTPVDENELEAVRAALRSRLTVEPCDFIAAGQRVRVEDGSLAGVEGLVLRVKSRLRLVISVTLLQRSVVVELDTDRVSVVEGGPRAHL
jgi:transcriptional antiterminator NusG